LAPDQVSPGQEDHAMLVATEGSTAQPPINYPFLRDQCLGDVEFIAKLLDTFLQYTPRELAELKAAATEGNTDKIAELAHRLKGNAATVAAESLHAQAELLEAQAKSGQCAEATASIAILEKEFDRVCAMIAIGLPPAPATDTALDPTSAALLS
ncbi:MAG TPA: Hpt domain-containing protein, partial [Armatimonadota bacterium]